MHLEIRVPVSKHVETPHTVIVEISSYYEDDGRNTWLIKDPSLINPTDFYVKRAELNRDRKTGVYKLVVWDDTDGKTYDLDQQYHKHMKLDYRSLGIKNKRMY